MKTYIHGVFASYSNSGYAYTVHFPLELPWPNVNNCDRWSKPGNMMDHEEVKCCGGAEKKHSLCRLKDDDVERLDDGRQRLYSIRSHGEEVVFVYDEEIDLHDRWPCL